MTGLRRFVDHGMADLDRRFSRVTAHVADRDREALSIVESSRAVALVAWVLGGVEAAARGSAVHRRTRAAVARWRRMPRFEQHRAFGWTLLVAAVLHVVLNSTVRATPGWLWLVIPVTAMTIGLVLIAGSFNAGRVGTKP